MVKKTKRNQDLSVSDAYSLFVYAIRTKITRDYYLRRLRTFFDFIKLLPNSGIELRCNRFAAIAIKDCEWTFAKIIGFLQLKKKFIDETSHIEFAHWYSTSNPISKIHLRNKMTYDSRRQSPKLEKF
jgi:hypothetical protein